MNMEKNYDPTRRRLDQRVVRRIKKILLKTIFPTPSPANDINYYGWTIFPIPLETRHQELSILNSVESIHSKNKKTVSVKFLRAIFDIIEKTWSLDLDWLHPRVLRASEKHPPLKREMDRGFDIRIFPGEHYRLLASFVSILKPSVVIEIGTHLGISALAMKKELPVGSKIHTFDICPWSNFPDTVLTQSDFDEQLIQNTENLLDPLVFEKYKTIFEEADLIFLDAAKDGKMEKIFLKYFSQCNFKKKPILVIDDIRLWNMLHIWNDISLPKLDITSFGHYTGTGIVDLTGKWQ